MRKLYFAIVTAMLLVSFSASAQFVQSGNGPAASSDMEKVFNTAEFSYSPTTLKYDIEGYGSSLDLNAVSLKWAQYRLLTPQLPIYLQYGAGLQYTWKSTKFDGENISLHLLTLDIPVNVAYNLTIPNTSLAILPYLGLNAQVHLLGKASDDEISIDLFGDDMEDILEEDGLNRFVLGWQIGAKVCYDRYLFGIGYNGPITNVLNIDNEFKINTSQVNISLGIKF